MRHPREMALANFMSFAVVFLPVTALPLLPTSLRGLGLAALALWIWMVFNVLCAVCARMDLGLPHPVLDGWPWLKAGFKERLAVFVAAGVLALWLALAWNFYHGQAALPVSLVRVLTGMVGALGLWLVESLLLGVGVAAEGGRKWFGVWKASALLPLAYFPS